MKMPVRPILFFLGLIAVQLDAQVASPSPLVADNAARLTVPGSWILQEQRADGALQNGFPATAAGIYHEIIVDRNTPPDTRQRVALSYVTALLDAGELAAAEQALQAYE